MTTTTILLALLVFAMVATRLYEEGLWRTGRISDRTNALLLVGRLPVLVGGFALITAQPLAGVGALTLGALLVAWLLLGPTERRLRRARDRSKTGR